MQENKQIIRAFLRRFSVGDVYGVLELLDEDVVWRVMGREGELPVSGEMDKDGIANLMETVATVFPNGMELTATGWTVEGDRVAVEVESYGQKDNGTIYNNLYHFLFGFADGQIVAIREYMDTLHVKTVFIDD
ncbi:nuclear transport factor 2 family protein [Kiloniella sp. EL199]|uniref:nuclear transport factor 2 family protein n=1 Tax=Kiloniella sp. EL199 TaxID=2107581 RepID=UPI001C1F48DF|nr:nuclear transport factor 2 family protein [Kiloniella sp. EL199]